MMKNIFNRSDKIEFSLNNLILYKTNYNGKECLKISSSKIVNIGEIGDILIKLKSLSHINLTPIYRITQHSIFTKKLVPLTSISNLSKQYKMYFIMKMKEVLEFLHENNMFCRNLVVEDFFIDEAGNPVLANYFSVSFIKSEDTFVDFLALDNISKSLTNTPLQNIVTPEIFKTIEERLCNFSSLLEDEKVMFLELINENKEILNEFIIKNIFNLLLSELKTEHTKEYKLIIMTFLKELDPLLFTEYYSQFFKILDSNVRLFLLKDIKSEKSLDSCVDDLALGIRVKDKELRAETLTFIFKNRNKFSKKSLNGLIDLITAVITDQSSIEKICNHFIENKLSHPKHLYKMIFTFLKLKVATVTVYDCLEVYYQDFDKYKLCSELLPLLCSRLSEKEYQDKCFFLVESIVKDLKNNKQLLENKEWGISKVTGFLKKSFKSKDKSLQEKIKELDELDEEWAEQDL
ncbi:hypothetical protein A0H76_77 [Hepatospora eriocheir]|uniref:Protein kinase domain-containing protein n=1 Tax=Hepatospora eriocheir TaxID=1081669 RepID=A0A1X0QJA7_9MICR|nr:hypothetical protein A0H76_77 [Hepatospora eriocheir]